MPRFPSIMLFALLSPCSFLLLLPLTSASTAASASSTAITTVPLEVSDAAERALYVRSILCQRMAYVESGKRMKDFAKWIKDRGGEATIFSMHGVDNDVDFSNLIEPETSLSKRTPFASDMLNLDLVITPKTPPSQYPGKPHHLLDSTPANIFQLCCRAIKLGFHFCPVLSTVGLAAISKTFRQKVWYAWVTSCIASSGAAWIKWGQWSSTRNDMFPEALCDQLATLHNAAPAHSWAFSERTLESSLGLARGSLLQVFDEFDQRPIASGSIAQVHKAILDGQKIAVKIRHPKVAQLIDMDFRLMAAAARVFDYIPALSWLRIRDSVEQFSHTMAAQSYLHVEAHHLEVLNYNFRNWPQVRFPQPFYAGSAVIMESFEPGCIVTDVLDMYDELADDINEMTHRGHHLTVKEVDDSHGSVNTTDTQTKKCVDGYELIPLSMAKFLVTSGLNLYTKMLLLDGVMHSDLHPGNILIDIHRQFRHSAQRDVLAMIPTDFSKGTAQLKESFGITLVDAGMVAQLTDEESSTFIGLLASVGEGDGKEAAEFALQFSLENVFDEAERASFIKDMEELFAERCGGYGTNVDVGDVLRGVLGLIRKHQVRIDANFATLVVNCLCVESLARQVCPTYNLLDATKPLLRSYRKMCYRPDGTVRSEIRRSRLVKARLSLMYLKKTIFDDTFFRIQAKMRRKKPAIEQRVLEEAVQNL